jgi:hypothetical protein
MQCFDMQVSNIIEANKKIFPEVLSQEGITLLDVITDPNFFHILIDVGHATVTTILAQQSKRYS